MVPTLSASLLVQMSILMGETQAEAEGLTLAQYCGALRIVCSESWREMLRDMDLNHDGFIQEQGLSV